ncbi:hypothetical protein LTR56_016083 [Elasticomyces elasticus]|nr:hypothetical protein LTR56_016083 [Elasticomyces elasticus]KAK3653815.1 hypothetical protein LTR22_011030 [Elasticomyces elasticus]KAK4916017.1 hypothetical protein LTR49_015928 [Elasticomyces elasticus]KAK5755399.1 hypothetical protein LTS12_014506 [Elasticomyces elasticus]
MSTPRTLSVPLDKASAQAATTDGLCGDRSHIKECAIKDCIAPKLLVVYTPDAHYSIQHRQQPASGAMLRSNPRILEPCSSSRHALKSLTARQKQKLAAASAASPSSDNMRETHATNGTASLPNGDAGETAQRTQEDRARQADKDSLNQLLAAGPPEKPMVSSSAMLLAMAGMYPGAARYHDPYPKPSLDLSDEEDWEVVDDPISEDWASITLGKRA